ncbi:hypothetical protein SAMN04487948_104427 [Halogranum amylolyticum]|uniref:Uncharacterized protein n=1 Tax=Halogranum amylolyticum TaxID=660520 RepID=A0A1H8S3K2_9EURY|nr:hypothetical protein [Halogranum amylolyticum]SEO73235.1 hypothetical protein SAMN04487948_104427 [Halogranum amylolyticum]
MNRRQVLLSLATTATVTVAGCLGSDQPSGETTANTNGDSETSGAASPESTGTAATAAADQTPALPDAPFEGMRADPAATYAVGKQGGTGKATPGAHVVQVWNDGDDAREVTVVITGEKTGTQFDETVEIAGGDHLNFAFETPDVYTVEVSGESFSSQATVDRDWNECSTSMSTIRVHENGTETRNTSRSRTCQ